MPQFYTDFSELAVGSLDDTAEWAAEPRLVSDVWSVVADANARGGKVARRYSRATINDIGGTAHIVNAARAAPINLFGPIATADRYIEFVGRFRFGTGHGGAYRRLGFMMNITPADWEPENYSLQFVYSWETSPHTYYIWWEQVNGGSSLGSVAVPAAQQIAIGSWVNMRVRVDRVGRTTRWRSWADGDPEPSGWTSLASSTTATGTAAIDQNGFPGLYTNTNVESGAHEHDFDWVGIWYGDTVANFESDEPLAPSTGSGFPYPGPGKPGDYFAAPSDLAFIPRVTYGAGPTVLDFTYPMRAWLPGRRDIGATARFPGGQRSAYKRSRFPLLGLTIEISERELQSVYNFIEYVIDNAAQFTFYPDKSDLATSYAAYLNEPGFGDRQWFPRQGQQLGLYEIDLVLESAAGARFDIRRFPA